MELVAMSIFVNRGRPEQSKRSVPQYTALLPTQAQVRQQGIHTVSASCVLLDPAHICRDCLLPKCSPGSCCLLSAMVEPSFLTVLW